MIFRRLFEKPLSPGQDNSSSFFIAGLGNPGRQYKETRHNIGFMVIDQLSKELNVAINRVQSKALVGIGHWNGTKVILVKPQTFMNLSGQAISQLIRYYKIHLPFSLVIHDDLDLPFGTLRIRPMGGPGGQKGLASIIQELGTQNFPRLRLGIDRPPGRMDPADYVLQKFSQKEEDILPSIIVSASDAVKVFITEGLDKAMNRFNGPAME